MAGKGDKQRPTDKARYDEGYDGIKWKRKECNCYPCRCVKAGVPEGLLKKDEIDGNKVDR